MSENKNGKFKDISHYTLADCYLPPSIDHMTIEFCEGVKVGENCRISALESIFCWMPGFLNCFTGFAGMGKTSLVLFLMLVKAKIDGWKFGIWSPEMIDVFKTSDGVYKRSASKLYNMLIHSLTGENPYKHKGQQMEFDQYQEARTFIEKHFFIIDTHRDKRPLLVIDMFRRLYDSYGINAWLVDPFKNLTVDENGGTKDRVLEAVFDDFEDLSLSTNTVGNFIAHPRSMDESKMRIKGNLKGPYKVVTQHDLLGGSVWDNSMDGIFSYHRQEIHDDPNSPHGSFYNLKQRSQEVTTRRGKFDNIYYDFDKNRFYFNGVCPLDGSVRVPVQANIEFKKPFQKKEKVKENAAGYPEHWDNGSNGKDNFPF